MFHPVPKNNRQTSTLDARGELRGNRSRSMASNREEPRHRQRQEARAERERTRTADNVAPAPAKDMFTLVKRSEDSIIQELLGSFAKFPKDDRNMALMGVDQQPPTPAPASYTSDHNDEGSSRFPMPPPPLTANNKTQHSLSRISPVKAQTCRNSAYQPKSGSQSGPPRADQRPPQPPLYNNRPTTTTAQSAQPPRKLNRNSISTADPHLFKIISELNSLPKPFAGLTDLPRPEPPPQQSSGRNSLKSNDRSSSSSQRISGKSSDKAVRHRPNGVQQNGSCLSDDSEDGESDFHNGNSRATAQCIPEQRAVVNDDPKLSPTRASDSSNSDDSSASTTEDETSSSDGETERHSPRPPSPVAAGPSWSLEEIFKQQNASSKEDPANQEAASRGSSINKVDSGYDMCRSPYNTELAPPVITTEPPSAKSQQDLSLSDDSSSEDESDARRQCAKQSLVDKVSHPLFGLTSDSEDGEARRPKGKTANRKSNGSKSRTPKAATEKVKKPPKPALKSRKSDSGKQKDFKSVANLPTDSDSSDDEYAARRSQASTNCGKENLKTSPAKPHKHRAPTESIRSGKRSLPNSPQKMSKSKPPRTCSSERAPKSERVVLSENIKQLDSRVNPISASPLTLQSAQSFVCSVPVYRVESLPKGIRIDAGSDLKNKKEVIQMRTSPSNDDEKKLRAIFSIYKGSKKRPNSQEPDKNIKDIKVSNTDNKDEHSSRKERSGGKRSHGSSSPSSSSERSVKSHSGSRSLKAPSETTKHKRKRSCTPVSPKQSRRRHAEQQATSRVVKTEELSNRLFEDDQSPSHSPNTKPARPFDCVSAPAAMRQPNFMPKIKSSPPDEKPRLAESASEMVKVESRYGANGLDNKPAVPMRYLSIHERHPLEPKEENGCFLLRAKELKHMADRETNRFMQIVMYLEAGLYFIITGDSMANDEAPSAIAMYSDTLKFIHHVSSIIMREELMNNPTNAKLAILSLWCQSLICMKQYTASLKEANDLQKQLADYFKELPLQTAAIPPARGIAGPATGLNGPGWNGQSVTNNSPNSISSTPSPADSDVSRSSSGYNTETNKPGDPPSNMTFGVPLEIMQCLNRHLLLVSFHSCAWNYWSDAEGLLHKYEVKDFFVELDRELGSLTIHSSARDLFVYIKKALDRLKAQIKFTGDS